MPKSVLIVDDEKDFTVMLAPILNMRGYQAVEANSGPEALQILSKDHVDVMTLDLSMPGMDGVEVIERVKEKYPSVKIIVISGFGREYDRETIEKKVDAVMEKPMNLAALLDKIKELTSS